MPGNSARARCMSVLSVTAAAAVVVVVALAACSPSDPGPIKDPSTSAPSIADPASTPQSTSPTPALAGQLTGPLDSSKVAYQQQVSGVVTGLPPGSDVWIVVYPESAPAYWPQPGPLQLDPKGGLQAVGLLRCERDAEHRRGVHRPARYSVPGRQRALPAFVAQPPTQGLPALPPGVRILAQATVTRR